jgi:hypothetical protein
MPVREVRVCSLGELIDGLTPSEPDPATGRRRDTGIYRGEPDAGERLLTSLDMLGARDGGEPHAKADLEEHILRNFARYSRPYLDAPPASDWELLASAQHHGVPTRLLDWSYSPLVAAHFATRHLRGGGADRDCAVWRLDWQAVHRRFGLPPLALLVEDLETLFDAEPGHERRDGRFTPWACFAGRHPRDFACMIEPGTIDARIAAQRGTFTICSDKTRPFDAFLEAHSLGGALTKYVVPADVAPRVRDQLDLVGMDERGLFPDLDGVAAELRRYYS